MDKITGKSRAMWNEYRFGHFNTNIYSDNRERLLQTFISNIPLDAKIFDIGCGTGYWIERYIQHGIDKRNIVGIDLSAKNVIELTKSGIRSINCSATSLAISDNVSDYTICNGVIHVTSDPFNAFQELVRITKPSGHIFLNVANKYNPYYFLIYKSANPLRYIYYRLNNDSTRRRFINIVYGLSKIIIKPLSLLAYGKLIDDDSGKTIFMDGVMAPKMELFTKKKIIDYANRCHCYVDAFEYNRFHLSLAAIIMVGDKIHN